MSKTAATSTKTLSPSMDRPDSKAVPEPAIDMFRYFNRFYTSKIGLLNRHLLSSPFTLTEARIFFEIATQKDPIAETIKANVPIDSGYLSRIISKFERAGWVRRTLRRNDRRAKILTLTAEGKQIWKQLNLLAQDHARHVLSKLSHEELQQMIDCMGTICDILNHVDFKGNFQGSFPPFPDRDDDNTDAD